jgi:hypothetical protein
VGRSSWLLALGLVVALPVAAFGDGLYLYRVPVTSQEPAGLALDAPLRIRAFVSDPAALAARLPDIVRSVRADHVELDLAGYPELEPRGGKQYRDASFVIDFEEPEVLVLHRELAARHGASPSLEEIREFTGESIPHKSMERGWDLASRVARTGVGDCTEHAVLLAALARSVARPARVVAGLLILRSGGELHALGHAWAEVKEGGRWVALDATPIAEEMEGRAYLPIVVLEEEGPGYALALGRRMQRTWVRRLEVEAAALPAGGDT